MRAFQILLLSFFVASCTADLSDSEPLIVAQSYLGLHERTDRQELKQLLHIDPVHTEWCAAFVNAVLEIDETPNLYDTGELNPLLARSFLSWGSHVPFDQIQPGDIVVFPRGDKVWQGHVGFYVSTLPSTGEWIILGGNQNNTVNYRLYHPSKAIGIRRWTE